MTTDVASDVLTETQSAAERELEHRRLLTQLRELVADALQEEPSAFELDEDLITRGIDSITMMTIAGQLQRAGVGVKFATLAQRPTLRAWQQLLVDRGPRSSGDGTSAAAAPASESDQIAPASEIDETAPFALAPLALAYWIGRSPEQPLGVGAHFYAELEGDGVEPARLEAAVRALIDRHAMLRARFLDDGTQQLAPHSPWPGLRTHDLRGLEPEQAQVELEARRDALAHRRLDVGSGELFDVQLSLLPGGAARTHIDIEMLAADAQSFRILLADLAALYDSPERGLPAIRTSYPRYLAAKRARRDGDWETARDYWRARLPELPGPPQLPLAVVPEQVRDPRATRRFLWLDADAAAAISAAARQHGLTPSIVFATAYAEVLARWSAGPRFLLNLPFYDREPLVADVELLVGDFTNVVLLDVDASAPAPFVKRAQALAQRLREDALHAQYTGVDVLRDLAAARPGEPVGAPVVFTSAISLGELFDAGVRRCFGAPVFTMSQTPQVWLDCQVTEREGGLYVNWDAVEELFPADMLDAMFEAFRARLHGLITTSSAWTAAPRDVLPDAQRAIRRAANDTAGPLPERCLHEHFFSRCRQRGDSPAVLWDGGALSHAQLGEQALRVASLLGERGVSPGARVAITLPKGPAQIVAALGVLAAGAAYVPVGIEQPPVRRARIAAAADIAHVIGEPELEVPEATELLTIVQAQSMSPLPAAAPVDPEQTAYVIFTSGSTGEPKGVAVPHRAALNTIDALGDRFSVGAGDRSLALSALDFDLSVYDIFGLLDRGGAVVIPQQSARRDPDDWVRLAGAHRATILNCVPALLDMLLEAAGDAADALQPLRLVLLGGDWVPLSLRARAAALIPECRFVALGGTTETAIHSTVCEVGEVPTGWRSIPYGRPLRNQHMRVVDARGGDAPDWVPGELWIGGASVAAGYHGDPERTARQFVVYDGARWYRTGDQARYWSDGTVEFLGRADHQIKLRGHRIELGEIESALESHPDVTRAVATVAGRETAARRLAIAFCARRPLEPDAVRAFIATQLPSHMVPELVVAFDELPLSANGKIDRRQVALTMAQAQAAPVAFEPPRGAVEHAVAAAWRELLGVTEVSRHDSFFALGGDSLAATRLIARLRRAGSDTASMRDLFAAPVLREFAARMAHTGDDSDARDGDAGGGSMPAGSSPPASPSVTADPAHRHEPFAATELQRAYWLGRSSEFTLGGVGSHWYWEFDGEDVDIDRLRDAMNRLVARHEMLRAVFDEDGRQRILPDPGQVVIPVTDADPAHPEAALADLRERLAHAVMDPQRWPLFEIAAVRYGARTRIGFGFDYIVLDALSIMIVFGELARLYDDPAATLAPIELSFRDYLLGTVPDPDAVQRSQQYWSRRIPDLPPAPQLPLRVDPSEVQAPRFARRAGRLTADQWRALVARGRTHNLTASTLLAAAYAEVLSAWSAEPELTLNFTLFDRREVHPDIDKVVGDFTSLMLVPHRPPLGGGWIESARRLQEQVWDGMAHRDVSAVQVVRELARRMQSPEVSMPVVFTSALGVAPGGFDLAAPYGSFVAGLSQTPQVWLDCQVMEHRGELLFNWDAIEELFEADVLDAMFDAFAALLTWLADPDSDWAGPPPEPLPARQRRVRERINATAGPLPQRPLHERFFALASERRERPAVLWGEDGVLSHGELADSALRIAAALRARGLTDGEPVLITLPKGADQVAAVLGTLAAGGVYVPIGVEQPPARRERIAASAGARLAVAEQGGAGMLTLGEAREHSPLPQPRPTDPDAPAYVIYTSGSTGEPKGVTISHRAALNTIDHINDRWEVSGEDRVLAISALDFDLSVYDIFGLLDRGGAIVVPTEDQRREARQLRDLMARHRVTVWNSVPALLDMLAIAGEDGGLPGTLRLTLVSGDWVGLELPERLHRLAPGARFVALGGATEASIWSNAIEVGTVPSSWRSIPYGYPLRNQRFRVVDARGRDRPDWVAGELWIGGAGVALGYRGDRRRTEQQFVTAGGERWYRTGDRGRYWPDGTLEFLGRTDHQIKLRGHRIELGEIEAALCQHPAVRRAVALLVGEPSARLVAFAATAAPAAELRELLAQRLPAYMIPEELHPVTELPLTANGKLDRSALARLAAGAGEPERDQAPCGALEETLASRWTELLGLDAVGRGDNFFALGGDSVMATRLVEDLRRRLGVALTLRQLFAAPTVQALAEAIAVAQPGVWNQPAEEGVI